MRCKHYDFFGHEEKGYRKKNVIRQEWRPVMSNSIEENLQKDDKIRNRVNDEAFISPRRSTRSIRVVQNMPTLASNRFQALLKEEIMQLLRHEEVVEVLSTSEQLIHYKVTQLSTQKVFHMTFIYCFKKVDLRHLLRSTLKQIATAQIGAWCVTGDIQCYHIWSRVDRALINIEWFNLFNFVQAEYMTAGSFDHVPIFLGFQQCPRSKKAFKNFDRWSSEPEFIGIVKEVVQLSKKSTKLAAMIGVLKELIISLKMLNRDRYADIHAQQMIT
ncbi:hypothetical protein Cgig2_019807 [Carnegiea gigantea]|uniref:Uncharacterized protein n=1 Tax=Carnegiea gigantea TaxID=171969 RepID=A0A9Q1Q9S4_9CARY|nr:hypothetical protein Cgig2_019807 [Carnegiea gigantea]